MRFRRLDLIRFGHFTDRALEFPERTPDIHFAVGPNEAGKTTVMRAVEDLLFGIGIRTPYSFLHPYAALRLGAVLESRGEIFEFRRRKGSKGTLLDPEDAPLPGGERRLAAFLGRADREFFGRMFNLGHERLARGGREILKSDGELGRTLFSAGSGLLDLRKEARRLDEEAVSLWAPRKARNRRYYEEHDRFSQAKTSLNVTIRRPKAWTDLRRAVRAAGAELKSLRQDYQAAELDSRTHGRVRRVLPSVRRRLVLEERLRELAGVVDLPTDAAERLAKAHDQRAKEDAALDVLRRQLAERTAETEALAPDDEVIARAREIGRLREVQIKVGGMRSDLPRRESELQTAASDLLREAGDLGWSELSADAVVERIPSRARVERARALREQRGALEQALSAAVEALDTARGRVTEREARVEAAGPAADHGSLAATLAGIPDPPGLVAREVNLREKLGEAEDRVRSLARGLRPAPPTDVEVEDLPVPAEPDVRRFRDRLRDLRGEAAEAQRRLTGLRRDLAGRRAERDRQVREEGVLPRDALLRARSTRDELWIRLRKQLGGAPAPEESDTSLVAPFEMAMRSADETADRRFDQAEAIGRLAQLDRTIHETRTEFARVEAESTALEEDLRRTSSDWREAWSSCGFAPKSPDAMLEWLGRREELVQEWDKLRGIRRKLVSAAREERKSRETLIEALVAAGVSRDRLQADPLLALVRQAEDLDRDRRESARRSREAQGDLALAQRELAGVESRVESRREAWERWQAEWETVVGELGLDPAMPPETLHDQIERFETMRQTAGTIRNLKERRIGAMRRDIVRFESEVLALATFDASLLGIAPDQAMERLAQRLEREQERRKRRSALEAEADDLRSQIAEGERRRETAVAAVRPLREAAGVEGDVALREAVERSDERRRLVAELEEVNRRLERDGDGLDFEALREECERSDPEAAAAREEEAEAKRGVISGQIQEAVAREVEAKSALDAFQGDSAAADLAAKKEQALEGMRVAAGRYAEVRTAHILLQWALEKFRRRNQEPMLRRAGELFRDLTDGSFVRLQVAFAERDKLRLEAVRPDDREVPVAGLSSGTEDQLFLALRIAAIEDYLHRGEALPFIADDLFVNFDDRRAAAGLRVLAALARKTQVLFFTHHEHLIEVARRALRLKTPVVRLEPVAIGSESPSTD